MGYRAINRARVFFWYPSSIPFSFLIVFFSIITKQNSQISMPCWDNLNWKCKIPFLVPGAFSVPIPPCIDIVQISKNIPQKKFLNAIVSHGPVTSWESKANRISSRWLSRLTSVTSKHWTRLGSNRYWYGLSSNLCCFFLRDDS